MKEAFSAEKELSLINTFATAPLKEEDVFIFTVTLCDNEVDRDFECFSTDTIGTLKELFIGKTGISDHSMRSKDQCARVFRTYTEKNGEKTSYGEDYIALKARAYMLRNEESASLISEIEGGIKKEVSVSCSVNKSTCSVCGGDMRHHSCDHIKGRYYNSKLCYAVLSEPTDAYEWSFVAVPAQRNAGVTKAFIKKEETYLHNPTEIIKSLSAEKALSEGEISALREHISALEEMAHEAEVYKSHLTEEIERLALIAMPKVNPAGFISACKSMKLTELRALRNELDSQVREKMPASLQLRPSVQTTKTNTHNAFKI